MQATQSPSIDFLTAAPSGPQTAPTKSQGGSFDSHLEAKSASLATNNSKNTLKRNTNQADDSHNNQNTTADEITNPAQVLVGETAQASLNETAGSPSSVRGLTLTQEKSTNTQDNTPLFATKINETVKTPFDARGVTQEQSTINTRGETLSPAHKSYQNGTDQASLPSAGSTKSTTEIIKVPTNFISNQSPTSTNNKIGQVDNNTASALESQTSKILQNITNIDIPTNTNKQPAPTGQAYILTPGNEGINHLKVGLATTPQAVNSVTNIIGANDTGIVVEQWSANFSPQQNQNTTATATAKPEQLTAQNASSSNEIPSQTVIQNSQGQVITVYQSSEAEELASSMVSSSRSQTTDPSGNRQDTNSNFIHSNLPTHTAKAESMAGTSSQQQKEGDPNQKGNSSLLTQEQKDTISTQPITSTNLATPTGEATSTDIMGPGSIQTTSSTTPTTTSFIRLPSGITVPESAIMDQVVAQLSNSRKLESGSMRIRLHPQELGELRMEIEVKQDNIKAHITTQNPQAQEALDRYLPKLRDALEQQGLNLSEIEITVDASDQYEGQRFQENMERQQLAKDYRSSSTELQTAQQAEQLDSQLINKQHGQGLSVVA